MDSTWFIVAAVALLASVLTFFSGFGLGTLLTPAFALFFPIEIAIGMTAIVHFANNIFKISLLYKQIKWKVAIPFALLSMIGALVGAQLLASLSKDQQIIWQYQIANHQHQVTLVKAIVGSLILVFTLIELKFETAMSKWVSSNAGMRVAALFSGFFGGLSGNQGALRSMFLIKCQLSKFEYVASGTFIACCIDMTRLSVYFSQDNYSHAMQHKSLMLTCISAALIGTLLGKRLLQKTSFSILRHIVSLALMLIALAMISGLI